MPDHVMTYLSAVVYIPRPKAAGGRLTERNKSAKLHGALQSVSLTHARIALACSSRLQYQPLSDGHTMVCAGTMDIYMVQKGHHNMIIQMGENSLTRMTTE